MQRRGFLKALGALVVGGIAGRRASTTPEHRYAATARGVYGNSGMLLAQGGVLQPHEWYLVGKNTCDLLPSPPQNVIADRRDYNDGWVIEWTRETETPATLRFEDVPH